MPAKSPGLVGAKREIPGSVQGEADPFNEVDMFVERMKSRLLRESEWRLLEEHFANLCTSLPTQVIPPALTYAQELTSGLIVPQWIFRNR